MTTRNVGGINPISGDYSVGAAGVWIEDGQEMARGRRRDHRRQPAATCLAGLVAVGDDFRWTPGGGASGSGALRFEGMTIAGS